MFSENVNGKKLIIQKINTKRMKNKWKLAFWISLIALIATNLFWFYQVIDQGVTITYMEEGYSDTENDLETLIGLINSTHLTKKEIKTKLENHRFYEFMDFKSDTIGLERVMLIFENNELKTIKKQW